MTYRHDPIAFVTGAAQNGRSTHVPAHLQNEYALVPLSMLGQAPPTPQGQALQPLPPSVLASGMSDGVKKILAIIAVVVIVLAIGEVIRRMMMKRTPPMTRNKAVKRLSTPQLAKTLYDRLEKRRDANPATMRSLQAYARKA